jgi:hypothetical protein
MFDAVVVSTADPELAARTLAGLVEGVVDGMVRRVVLLSSAQSAALRELADAAGCRAALGVPPGGVGAALKAHVETPHVLALRAGALLPPGWPDVLRGELQRRGPPAADAGLAFTPVGLGARLALTAAIASRRPASLAHGALAPQSALVDRAFDGAALASRKLRMVGIFVGRMDAR